ATITTPTARRWPTCWPACRWASSASTPRSPAWAAAPSPRAPPATWPPRTWSTCCTAWASRPGWISMRWSRPASGSRRSSAGAATRAPATRSPRSARPGRKPPPHDRDQAAAAPGLRGAHPLALHLGLPDRSGRRPVRRLPAHDRRDRELGRDAPRTARRGLAADRRAARGEGGGEGSRRGPARMNGLPDTVRFIERDWLSSNQVFLVDGAEATIVDTGYVKHAPMTAAIVGRLLEQTGTRLARIVNTHLHSDHCGGNRLLAERFGGRTLVPQASLADVASWDEQALTFAATGQRCDRFV